ncbi:MAG: 50S ribosomal protein L10 [Pseudomonadota bacterium]
MDRVQKQELVAQLHDVFSSAGVVVVTHYKGLTVAEMTDLRTQVREVGGSFKVTKNRLTKLALKDTQMEGLSDLFSGTTAIAYAPDVVSVPKVLTKYVKDNEKLEILGGAMEGEILGVDGVKALSELPSLDELRGKIVGMLQTPASRMAQVTAAPAGQLARVFGAYGSSEG